MRLPNDKHDNGICLSQRIKMFLQKIITFGCSMIKVYVVPSFSYFSCTHTCLISQEHLKPITSEFIKSIIKFFWQNDERAKGQTICSSSMAFKH